MTFAGAAKTARTWELVYFCLESALRLGASLKVQTLGAQFPGAFVAEMAWDGKSFRGVMQHVDPKTGELDPVQYA